MLTRRQGRIKVMQQLYGYWQDQELPVPLLKKNLRSQFDQTYNLYLFTLMCVGETAAYAKTYASIQAGKFLATEAEKKVSARIADTPLVQFLQQNEAFNKLVKKSKLKSHLDEEVFRQLFKKLTLSDLYIRYADDRQMIRPSDEEVLSYLFKEIMLVDENFDHYLESIFPAWIDDYNIISMAVLATIEGLCGLSFQAHEEYLEKQDEVIKFSLELLEKTVAHKEETEKLIAPKLENWDPERVAVMDMLLMNMALTEILDFPTIPVKVTMNEYIDISKSYSTPKSREFINGVLDKVVKDLKDHQRIFKSGRGLQE